MIKEPRYSLSRAANSATPIWVLYTGSDTSRFQSYSTRYRLAVSRPASGVTCISPTAFAGEHVVLIEGALRPHDRVDDAAIDFRTGERIVRRHADLRKSVFVHRHTSGERCFSEYQHSLRVAVVRSELAQRRECAGVATLFGEIG